jgi:hypothetical protein
MKVAIRHELATSRLTGEIRVREQRALELRERHHGQRPTSTWVTTAMNGAGDLEALARCEDTRPAARETRLVFFTAGRLAARKDPVKHPR